MSAPGTYDPRAVEPEIYAFWEAGGYFNADADPSRKPFTIVIPPPNVTGALHLGHALNNTIQDLLIRRKRMQGYVACWLPGTDHAGIATQAVVEKRLKEEQNLSRHELGREGLVQKIWEWKEDYNGRILGQLRRMGCSCDWRRMRFTLDEQCAKAVYETFFRMFKDGLIYRGLRMVNWDAQLQTAIADDEIEYKTVKTSLWHIRYPILGVNAYPDTAARARAVARATSPDARPGVDYLVVATTRPETMLADTAVAVHPDDERYQPLIGQSVLLPLMWRPIPLVADGLLVKKEFGTGCVKVTPGHDPNDNASWQRKLGHADEIRIIDLLTPDGKINEHGRGVHLGSADSSHVDPSRDREGAGAYDYSGLRKEDARKKIVADLEALGLLEKVEPYETEVGHSDRSKAAIEPLRSEQWFVRMGGLAEMAMEAARDGRVRFFPGRYAKTYLDWLGEKRDWCISRQLWWGHRIPVWTKSFGEADEAEAAVQAWGSRGERVACRRDGSHVFICAPQQPEVAAKLEADGFVQDPDVLDTWFSSALWPHSTFGWPHGEGHAHGPSRDLDYFYPTSVLSTAREIITLWVARMVMTGLYNTGREDKQGVRLQGRVPFQHVYIHAVIQDAWGSRMSKSAGNGMDPLDLIDAYGADAMRFSLAQMAGETQDVRVPGSYRCPHCAGEFAQQPGDLKKAVIACRLCKKDFATRVADAAAIEKHGLGLLLSPRFELGRNLVNKLWQAATGFVIPTCRDVRITPGATRHTSRRPAEMPLFEKWIRVKLLACIREIDTRLDDYEFSSAVESLRAFFWNVLCDWYIEEVKSHLRDTAISEDEQNDVKVTLLQVFDTVLCLFHPVIPFVTEAIWKKMGEEIPAHHALIWPSGEQPPAQPPALIQAPWPRWDGDEWLAEVAEQDGAEREVDVFLSVVRALREIRTSLNAIRSAARQSALRALPAAAIRCGQENAAILRQSATVIARLGQVEPDGLTIGEDVTRPPAALSRILSGIEVYVAIAGLADLEIERKRLAKEREEVRAAIGRVEAKLNNAGFVAKAPPAVIEDERKRMAELGRRLAVIEQNLAELG